MLLGRLKIAPFRTAKETFEIPKDNQVAISDQSHLADNQILPVGDEQSMSPKHMLKVVVKTGTDTGTEEALCRVKVRFRINWPVCFFKGESWQALIKGT